jgi:hypothetical protein
MAASDDDDPLSYAETVYHENRLSKHDAEEAGLGRGLCRTCTYGTVMKSGSVRAIRTYCGRVSGWVAPDIIECTRYLARDTLDLDTLTQLAVIVDPRVGVDDRSYR